MTTYSHHYSIGFSVSKSTSPNGSTTTADQLRAALLTRVEDVQASGETFEAVGLPEWSVETAGYIAAPLIADGSLSAVTTEHSGKTFNHGYIFDFELHGSLNADGDGDTAEHLIEAIHAMISAVDNAGAWRTHCGAPFDTYIEQD